MFVLWSRRIILFVFPCGEICNKNTARGQIQFIVYAHICLCVRPSTWPNVSSCSFPSLCCLPSSSLVSRSPLFSLHSSPGGDYDWHDTNVSTSCSAAHRQGRKKKKKKREAVSPISRLHCLLPPSSLLSAGRRGWGLSPCDITALCLPHGGSGFSTMD